MSYDSSDSDDDFFDAEQDIAIFSVPKSPLLIDCDVTDHRQISSNLTTNDEALVEVIPVISTGTGSGELHLEEFIKAQGVFAIKDAVGEESTPPYHQGVREDDGEPNKKIVSNLVECEDEKRSEISQSVSVSPEINQPAAKNEQFSPTKAKVETPDTPHHSPLTTGFSSQHVEVVENAVEQNQPDIVASSMLERPTILPLPHPVLPSNAETDYGPSARPKRPPPPRPKLPPQRPPPPRKKSQPVLSPNDDGLLTPNSTVTNLTRDFEAAVLKPHFDEQLPTDCTSIPRETDETKFSVSKNIDPLRELGSGSPVRSQNKSSIKPKTSTLPTSTSQHMVDDEILSTVIVRNLDTGQTMPLSAAAEQVSQYLNPLALQIMSRTKEFNCPNTAGCDVTTTVGPTNKPLDNLMSQQPKQSIGGSSNPSDEDSVSVASDEIAIGTEAIGRPGGGTVGEGGKKLREKSKKIKKIWGKRAKHLKEVAGTQVGRAVQKVRSGKMAGMVEGGGGVGESLNVSSDEEDPSSIPSQVKVKAASSNKGPHHFAKLKMVQDIAVHVGAVWSMKFSHCGRLLATAGQNNIIWVWVLKEYYAYFNELRNKYDSKERGAVFATPPRSAMEGEAAKIHGAKDHDFYSSDLVDEEEDAPFRSLPFSSYVGHTADVLDLAWSKNYFTLSSSMDKTVRLWHVSQKECLCCFQHIDFVTAIAFHPKDDRYFLSGSLDGKLRLWNIPEKKVALWNEVTPDSSSAVSGPLITTVNFCENGKFAVCGTYDGRALFYDTEHLKYNTQIHVRSSRRRNSKGHKITGIEPLHGEHKILITSNDSRVRLYDLRDLSLACKYKGLTNTSSQIKANFSHDCKFIICGSEDKSVYIWKTHLSQDVAKISSLRRDRNDQWESIRSHDAVVTCAIFAPFPQLVASSDATSSSRAEPSKTSSLLSAAAKRSSDTKCRHVIISADFTGVIKVFMTC